MSLADSFPPSPGPDQREWSHVPPRPLPSEDNGVQSPTQAAAMAGLLSPRNTTQTVSFLRIGRPGYSDSRERLQSVASTLSQHVAPANTIDAIGQVRADRIGSLDDPAMFTQKRRDTTVTFLDEAGRRKSGLSAASTNATSMGSFSIERARRASMSVRKVSAGGQEELMPVTIASSDPTDRQPGSPADLDARFAKPVSLNQRPSSGIDFTEPFEPVKYPPPPVTQMRHFSSEAGGQRDSLMPTAECDKRMSIEPALPSSKLCSPSQPPPDRCSVQLLSAQNFGHMDTIPDSPMDPGLTNGPTNNGKTTAQEGAETKRDTVCSGTSKTSRRSSISRKKRRPDSIDLAMLRSPKLAIHPSDHLSVPSPSPPPLTAALNDLKSGIASSVIALKSATTSAHFPYSVPSTPSPKTVVPRTPRTPRTATSEGGHSMISDLESAQLFQAWKGFRAPPTPDPERTPIRRAISAPHRALEPRVVKEPITHEGDRDLAVEVVGSGAVTPVQTRPPGNIDFTVRPADAKLEQSTVEPNRNTLIPSPPKSPSSSPQPRITPLSQVVKEEEKRRSLTVELLTPSR